MGSSFTVETPDAALAQELRERIARVTQRSLPAVEPLGRCYAVSLSVDSERPGLVSALLGSVRDLLGERGAPRVRVWARGVTGDVDAAMADDEVELLAARLSAQPEREPRHLPGVPFS